MKIQSTMHNGQIKSTVGRAISAIAQIDEQIRNEAVPEVKQMVDERLRGVLSVRLRPCTTHLMMQNKIRKGFD
jgi:hypothetical protein